MYACVIRRILATIPVMVVVGIFVFLLLHITPGDPAAIIAGDYANPAGIAKVRARLGRFLSRNISPMFCCGRQSACVSGPYSFKPPRRSIDYAFSVFQSVRPTTTSILAPSRRTSVKYCG